jgi:tight adherence protein C
VILLAEQLFNFSKLVPFAVFGACTLMAWFFLELIASGKPKKIQRLESYMAGRDEKKIAIKKKERITKVFKSAAPKLAEPLKPKDEVQYNKLKLKLAGAGFRGQSAASAFLSIKVCCFIFGFVIGIGIYFGSGMKQSTLLMAISAAGMLFYLPGLAVSFIASGRRKQIFLGLPDALDLMVVCVEAGLGLDQAMRKVAEELKKSHPVMAEEFSVANLQLQVGHPRNSVLTELGLRSGVDELKALASVLIQADKFGSSVSQALRVQSDTMRTRRRQLAEEKAAKTAVKMIFPLVLFIFPGIFVVLVGPAAIRMAKEMFNNPMNG